MLLDFWSSYSKFPAKVLSSDRMLLLKVKPLSVMIYDNWLL